MRRIAALLIAPLLLVTATACGSDDSGKSGEPPAVSGAADKKPKIEKGAGDPPKDLKVKVLKEGDGATLKKGDALTANYLGQLWDGKVFDNSWDRGQPATFEIGTGKVVKGWDEGLVGQKLGSRVELVIPPDKGYGDQGQGQTIPPKSTLVFVVDLKSVTSNKPEGKVVEQKNEALPKVGTNTDGKAPSVTIPKGDAPEKQQSETIIEGNGKAVGKDDTVQTQFEAFLWKDSKPLDNTWSQSGIQSVALKSLPGWQEGLAGKKVGSRVLMVVPKSALTAEQQKQFDSPVVFVVDILGIG
ncbi:FKBP-type peptidyl-prolyl cis-trans isomerase [Streptomyces sp. ISL-11]|uniref:FKBP-type peptidyl-prolyl cis-trans isomerase n=1 Tax=Streptomyces sp. ISL-11 TaxID=2819174 RepID=UPI001BEA358D|nr:FKBP-type peptidyl-prolyl cis-trans isomerase [Streptomyces sp. ISL-11]MBT2384732.1 FKBP-type peptidyl-prolyl cis-trans isomerase [Streptomyces sp. ISL-11]